MTGCVDSGGRKAVAGLTVIAGLLLAPPVALAASAAASGAPASGAPASGGSASGLASGLPAAGRRSVEGETQGFRLRADAPPPAVQPLDFSRFNFTVPRDPAGRSGVMSRTPGAVTGPDRSFRFTPSRSTDGRAVTVGVATRAVTAVTEPASPGLRTVLGASSNPMAGPSGYSVDMALGWQRFSLSGGVDRVNPGNGLAARQEMDVGLSYGGRRWRTGIVASAERGSSFAVPLPGLEGSERLGLEATGALNLSRSLSVSGGIRYRTAPPGTSLIEINREEERVYLGGALAF